jgi:hypothetical protein
VSLGGRGTILPRKQRLILLFTVLKQSTFGNANKIFTDNAKDYTGAIVTMGMNFAKDANKDIQATAALSLEQKIRESFSVTVKAWKNATEEMNKAVFRGDGTYFQGHDCFVLL